MTSSLILPTLLALALQAAPQTPAAPTPPTRAQVLRGEYGKLRSNNDLLYYHLDVKVDPDTKTIAGKNTITFRMLSDDTRIQIDLYANLHVDKILMGTTPLKFERELNAVFITFPAPIKAGREVSIDFYYSGTPTQTGRFGGFTFSKDPAGRPWIFTACEGEGSSIWWPSKDQWKDEVESMDISVTAPSALIDVSNGRFMSKKDAGGGFTQWNYHVNYPINSYDVSLNIGKYEHFSDTTGTTTLDFYALPEDLDKAKTQFAQAKTMIEAYKHYFGEYPFDKDGYKLIQAPYTGMEHQSAVTYGNGFKNGYPGGRDYTGVGISMKFDFIIIHESGHEWFGNAVSAADVSDMWIQEGWTNYLESLYVEQVFGHDDGIKYANSYKSKVQNRTPIITPRGRHQEPPQDMYFKGGLFLHTMRGVMNDDAKWWALVRETYNTFKYKNILTEDVASLFTTRFGKDMTPIFNQYLRHTAIPTLNLVFDAAAKKVSYRWTVDEPKFAMPIRVGSKTAWQTITPTVEWQTMDTSLTKDTFDVATDLYFVNVTKSDKSGALPAAPAAAARPTPPEQKAYDEANKIKDLPERLAALRKVQAEYGSTPFMRQVNSTVFTLLVGMPDKKSELNAAFDRVATDTKSNTNFSPETQVLLLVSPISRALDAGIVLDNGATAISSALAALTPSSPASTRASGTELRARLYQAKGDMAAAEREYTAALALDPSVKFAPAGLAKIESGRGDNKAALAHYLQAASAGSLKADDEAAFRALYTKVNGSDTNINADMDRAFADHFPNPVEPEKWRPSSSRTKRIVLGELFTGSACPPCVAADYGLDAVRERYPSADLATLVYHVHIPGPDPMTTAASVARKDYYKQYVLGVPTFIVDGGLARLGGGGREQAGQAYGNYASVIDRAMNTAPEATLSLKTSMRDGKLWVATSISGLAAAYKSSKALTLQVALAEQQLTFSGENGMRVHPLVVRAMIGGDTPGVSVTIDETGRAMVDAGFDLSTIPTDITTSLDAEIKRRRGLETAGSTPSIYKAEGHPYTTLDPSKLIVVAFLQDGDKHVLQAVQRPLNDAAWRKTEKK